MTSAAQDELGTLFMNCKETIPVHKALEEMGNNQPLTPMQTDNTLNMAWLLTILQAKG